ncbi:hypothetical protein B0H16DRAFT_1484615, partial [Mycena metata]
RDGSTIDQTLIKEIIDSYVSLAGRARLLLPARVHYHQREARVRGTENVETAGLAAVEGIAGGAAAAPAKKGTADAEETVTKGGELSLTGMGLLASAAKSPELLAKHADMLLRKSNKMGFGGSAESGAWARVTRGMDDAPLLTGDDGGRPVMCSLGGVAAPQWVWSLLLMEVVNFSTPAALPGRSLQVTRKVIFRKTLKNFATS